MTGVMRPMRCCCCGASAGRWQQWWNRDTGYGVCTRCVARLRATGTPELEITNLYGTENVNWGEAA